MQHLQRSWKKKHFMKQRILIWKLRPYRDERTENRDLEKEEYSYEGAHGFIPVMVSYMHEDDKIHPAMIVVPGGGYRQVSRTEAHLVAMDFYEADYNVFVLVYTVNPLDEVPLEMQPLQDISRVIRMIRGKAEEYRITPEQIAVCGFSAGGIYVPV